MPRAKKDSSEDKLFHEKYTKALGEFICAKVEDGISVRQLCKKYKEHGVPREKTIYRWCKKYPEFKVNMQSARQTWFIMQMDELDELSKELMHITHKMEEITKEEMMSIRLYADGLRQRIDVLKFSLAKIACKFVPELQEQSQQIVAMPTINIISYAKEEPKKLLDVTPSGQNSK